MTGPSPTRRRIIPALLREREFGTFWGGQTISLFGDQITIIAVPLLAVLRLGAGPTQMGALTAAGLAPHLLLSLPAGVWLDRVARRRYVMIAADLARVALIGGVAAATIAGHLTIAMLYVAVFLTGCASVFFDISYATLFVSLVPRDDYMQANSLLSGSRSLAFIGGPSVGGVLVDAFGAATALLVDAASFVVSAVMLGRLRTAEPPVEVDESTVGERMKIGFRFIGENSIMRPLLTGVAVLNFFNFAFFALVVLFATRTLHIRPGTLGAVLGAGALGGIFGAIIASRVGRRMGVGPALILGCLMFPLPQLLIPLAGGPRPLMLGMLFTAEFLAGVGVMLLDVNANSVIAALTPDRLRARATGAFRFVNYGVRPLGSLTGGALGSLIGLRPTLLLVGGLATTGVLFVVTSPIRTLRELPESAQ